jgi:hypothetical protein
MQSWRSLKYEEIYLKAYETPRQAEIEIGRYFRFYNEKHRMKSITLTLLMNNKRHKLAGLSLKIDK